MHIWEREALQVKNTEKQHFRNPPRNFATLAKFRRIFAVCEISQDFLQLAKFHKKFLAINFAGFLHYEIFVKFRIKFLAMSFLSKL